jgi:hypothetical protein
MINISALVTTVTIATMVNMDATATAVITVIAFLHWR